jgi:transcription initiation factor TFIIIB Brf1 subunit/transcription initiation factor TFIIB
LDKDAITKEACPRTVDSEVAPRKLDDAFFEKYIESVAEELQLPEDVARTAVETFSKAKGSLKRFGRRNVALACLALSVKATCLPVSLTELLRAAEAVSERVENVPYFRISRRAVATAYRKLAGMCEVKASVCQLTPTIYLERLLKEFEATADERKKAAELNRKILEAKLHVGKYPPSIAAATACIAFAGRVAQRQLAEVTGVTEVTVRNNVKRIMAELKIPLSEAFP